jgi:hypothetical protein
MLTFEFKSDVVKGFGNCVTFILAHETVVNVKGDHLIFLQ